MCFAGGAQFEAEKKEKVTNSNLGWCRKSIITEYGF